MGVWSWTGWDVVCVGVEVDAGVEGESEDGSAVGAVAPIGVGDVVIGGTLAARAGWMFGEM